MAEKNIDPMDKIKDFLSRDDAADKISAILGALGGGSSDDQSSQPPNTAAISGLLGDGGNSSGNDLQIATILRLKSAYDAINKQEDSKLKLLEALRPYLQHERIQNLDTAIKMLRLVRLAPLLGELKDFF